MSKIHPTAAIAAGARVASDVEIGPYSVIETNAEIAPGCFIGPHVHIGSHVKLGKNCEVYYGANLDMPQDYTWDILKRPESWTEIGEGTVIREYVTIHRPAKEGAKTVVGANCMIMAFAHIGHDGHLEDHVTLANHATLAGSVHVGRGAVISGYVMVHQFCRIGALAFVSPRVNLRQDTPPFCLVADNGCVYAPNVVGLRRAGFDAERRALIEKAVKTLFHKGLNRQNAIAEIAVWDDLTDDGRALLAFLEAPTKFGIVPGPAKAERRGESHSAETEDGANRESP